MIMIDTKIDNRNKSISRHPLCHPQHGALSRLRLGVSPILCQQHMTAYQGVGVGREIPEANGRHRDEGEVNGIKIWPFVVGRKSTGPQQHKEGRERGQENNGH